MNLEQLTQMGGIIPAQPIPQEITWTRPGPDGEELSDTFTIHVKRLAYGDYERMFLDRSKEGEGEKDAERSWQARMIAAAVRLGEKANEELSYEQAYQLEANLARAFADAVATVNGRPEKKR